jgi:DNA-directed RNA polymerase subunit omega
MSDDYFKEALEIVKDPFTLANMVSERVKMLRGGNRPLVASIEELSTEDVALLEIIEGRIAYVMGGIVIPGTRSS